MKRYSKAFFSFLLIMVISFTNFSFAYANTNTSQKDSIGNGMSNVSSYPIETKYIKAFIKHMHSTDVTIKDCKTLLDSNLKESYLYVTLSNNESTGYAILRLEDMSIIELSLTHLAPFSIYEKVIYLGPLNYVREVNDKYVDVHTNKIISLSDMNEVSDLLQSKNLSIPLSTEAKQMKAEKMIANTASATRVFTSGSGDMSWAFKAGDYYGDCGINAIAMIEKWYDLYVSPNYLPDTLSAEIDIKRSIYNYCVNHSYPTTSISENILATIIYGHSSNVGLSGDYLYATSSTYDWASTCSRVNSNEPTILATIDSTPTYKRHYIIAVGYTDDGIPSNNQLYVNDGFKNYVWLSSSYMQVMVPTY